MHFTNLYDSVRTRYGTSDSAISMGDWMCANTTIRRQPFSFERYPFQQAIADDMHPDMSVEKCSQIGLTEIQIRKFLGVLTRGTALNGLFTFPDQDMQRRQYNSRLKPILDADSVFNPVTETKPVRRVDQVQIRDSFGYITGCGEKDATATSADFLFHDELDLSPEDMIALFQSRLQNSDMRMTQRFSTPTFRDYGINRQYQLTDQREYMCRCPACNHYQVPQFNPRFVNIPDFPFDVKEYTDLSPEQALLVRFDEAWVVCEKCRGRLDLSRGGGREWVAKYPTKSNLRGYKVRPFSTGRLGPGYVFRQMAKYMQSNNLRAFYNTVLGEPYTRTDAQIQENDINACFGEMRVPDITPGTPVFLGMDVGLRCHLTLSIDQGARPVFILFETLHNSQAETRIAELREEFNIVQGCADRFPYTPLVDSIRDASDNIVMPIRYGGEHQLTPSKDELGRVVWYNANRTQALDRIQTLINRHVLVMCGYSGQKETIVAHLQDMVRDDSRPEKGAVWVKKSNNDHYFHSMALNLLSRRISGYLANQEDVDMRSTTLILPAAPAPANYGYFSPGLARNRLGLFNF